MSHTYRRSDEGGPRSDGGRQYASPRYRPGTRGKPHRITAVGVRRESPDLERLSRAIARAALQQTVGQTGQPNNSPDISEAGR